MNCVFRDAGPAGRPNTDVAGVRRGARRRAVDAPARRSASIGAGGAARAALRSAAASGAVCDVDILIVRDADKAAALRRRIRRPAARPWLRRCRARDCCRRRLASINASAARHGTAARHAELGARWPRRMAGMTLSSSTWSMRRSRPRCSRGAASAGCATIDGLDDADRAGGAGLRALLRRRGRRASTTPSCASC